MEVSPVSVQSVLQRCANKFILEDSSYVLEVKRSSLWKSGLIFYKQAMVNPDMLRKNLTIDFVGEEGVDAGALKAEFFDILIKEMDRRLFEGNPEKRIPKKSWQGGPGHKLAGMIIGHSLLQNGPSYPCLAPCAYAYIATGNEESALDCFPTVEDIPLNAGTSSLHDCLREVIITVFIICLCFYAIFVCVSPFHLRMGGFHGALEIW